ncbi:MAG: transcriptional regulator with XRE-family HTH domain [Oceanospirillaceae bacterium]
MYVDQGGQLVYVYGMVNQSVVVDFGLRIKQLRRRKGISQEQLSFLTGFHRTYVGMIERGERNISLDNIAIFAKVFEISISELLDFTSVSPEHDFTNYSTKVK